MMCFLKNRCIQILLGIQMLSVIDVSYLRSIFDFVEQTPVLQKSVQEKPNKVINFVIKHGKIVNFFMTYKTLYKTPFSNETNDQLIIFFRSNGEWASFKNHPLPVYQKASGQYKFPLEERDSFEHSFHTMLEEEGVESGYLVFSQDEYTPHPDGRILDGEIIDHTNRMREPIRFRVICDPSTNRWLLHLGPGEPRSPEEEMRRLHKMFQQAK